MPAEVRMNRDLLGRVCGYAVIDLLLMAGVGYAVSVSARTSLAPTIAVVFILNETVQWSIGSNTPLLSAGGITFFPAPAQGRHLNNRACNCN